VHRFSGVERGGRAPGASVRLPLVDAVIVHYHEISLKGGNRPLFLRRLVRNLAQATAGLGVRAIHRLPGRIVLDLEPAAPLAELEERIGQVFGIANFSSALRVPARLEAFREAAARLLEGRSFESFRITARRTFKAFPMTSEEVNRDLGAFVLSRFPTRVNLDQPALTVYVEILPREAFVYADRRPGPGGLPVGVSGGVVALLSGGIDSPVAAWRMLRRGCEVIFVHFHSYPYLPDTSQAKARTLVRLLTRHQYASRLWLVPFGELQREVVLSVVPPLRVVVYRRLMARIAEALARREGARALVTGESVGQVASQTLENLARTTEVVGLPILRPLIGMDKEEIVRQARQIGSYEISIEPDQDCCTLFVPPHPETRAAAEVVAKAEAALEIERLVRQGVEGARLETFVFPEGVGVATAALDAGRAP